MWPGSIGLCGIGTDSVVIVKVMNLQINAHNS